MQNRIFKALVTAVAVSMLAAASAQAQRPVTINVGSGAGRPGELVTINVTLDINANLVAATDNFITFASPIGVIECALAEQFVGTLGSQVVLRPDGCDGDPNGACTSARGLIINDNLEPIVGSDVLLYSCDLRIAFDAEAGTYPLVCSDPLASSPQGQPYNGTGRCRESILVRCETDEDCASVDSTCRVLGETLCPDGSIEVSGEPLPTHTVTPTGTITPTRTPGPVIGELATSIGPTDEVIPLVDSAAFGESGTIEIGGERITYRANVGNDLVEAQRGKAGTLAADHPEGAQVNLIAANSGGAGGGRGCAIAPARAGSAWWLLAAAGVLAIVRFRSRDRIARTTGMGSG